jgi:hypothetical protein
MMRRRPSRFTQSSQEGGFVRQGRGVITVTTGLVSSGLPVNATARFAAASTTFCITLAGPSQPSTVLSSSICRRHPTRTSVR